MELIAILQALARHRMLVALGAVLAAAAGLLCAGALPGGPGLGSETRSGIAEARALVNTPSSYAGDLEGGTEALGSQAALLATLIADERQSAAIARAAGIPAAQMEVLVGGITEPKVPSRLARTLSEVIDRPRRPYAITVRADSSVSIITVQAAAPTVTMAARLARAATAALTSVTAASAPSRARALVVEPLGAVRSLEVVDKPPSAPLIGLIVTLAFFLLWSSALIILSGIVRVWRAAAPAPAG